MKSLTITIAALIVALCFSGLLIQIAAQDREIVRQKAQISIMKETTEQARKAFDRMRTSSRIPAVGETIEYISIGHNFVTGETSSVTIIPPISHTATESAIKDLDAKIKTLEIVSKER